MSSNTIGTGGDPKKWPLARYYWAAVVYALKHHKQPPRLEFYFDGVRSLTLRIDEEQPSQFLLSQYIESSEAFFNSETNEALDLDTIPESEWPKSRWETSLGFSLIIEDDDDTSGNVFACEIPGNPSGITSAIDAACQIFKEERNRLSNARVDENDPALDAVITRWNEQDEMHESDRRYHHIYDKRGESMHAKGTPHDSTLLYAECGRNTLLMLRTIIRSHELRKQWRFTAKNASLTPTRLFADESK